MSTTPGQWTATIDPIRGAFTITCDGFDICQRQPLVDHNVRIDECVANAHLIAAAPDLLLAVEVAIEEEDAYERGERVFGRWKAIARAALAKAEGRG